METTLRYNYRLRPSKTARLALESEWDRVRYVWNRCVEERDVAWRERNENVRGKQMGVRLTELRGEHEWLRDGASVVQRQAIRTWDAAVAASFKVKGRGRPRFKSFRRDLPSLQYTRNGFRVEVSVSGNDRLHLAKGISIPMVSSRELPAEPSSVRVFRDSLGHWYASFVVKTDVEPNEVEAGSAIGVDWGIKTVATTTAPAFDLSNRRHGKAASTRIAQAQRKMVRRRGPRGSVPSKGYLDAKRETAKLYAKALRQRQDDATKFAVAIARNFETIAVEDFKPAFLTKNRSLAKAAADAACGQAKRALVERGERAGRRVVLVNPAHTSQTCSRCGARAKQHLELKDRVFDCHACKASICRDLNAARNILARAGQPL